MVLAAVATLSLWAWALAWIHEAAAASLAGLMLQQPLHLLPAAAAVGTALLGAWVVRLAWTQPLSAVRWDGAVWCALMHGTPADEAQAGRLEIVADLDRWMLLRWRPQSSIYADLWLTVSPSSIDVPWHAWRCALYCARPAGESPDSATQPLTSA